MRLTLRTLLAYLDDILEPAQAKEIGEKIAESPVASELANRIRETLRRRRITAPQISGPGSGPDPNLTAEYLDLTLSPEGVSEFEQFCMDSDLHLAEVAACHQILTLVLGEPADVSTELRERMYALGSVAPSEATATGGKTVEAPGAAASELSTSGSQATSFNEGLPQQLRRTPIASRLIPAAIVLICAGWLALLYFDPYLRNQDTPTDEPGAPLVAAVEPDPEADTAVEQPSIPPEVTEEQPADNDTPSVVETVEPEPVTPDVEPDTVEPETPVDATATVAATAPESTPDAPVVPTPEPDAFQEPPQPVEPVMILYNSPEGILLQHNEESGTWTVLPRRALLHPGDEIACPNPFTARLQIDEGHCLITLAGGTRLRLTGASGDAPFGMELLRGRVGVFRTDSGPAADDPVPVGLRVLDRSWSLRLLTPDTWCGLDFVPVQPHGRTDPQPPATPGGGIFVARGTVQLEDAISGKAELQPENGWRAWDAGNPGAPLLAVPNWLSPEGAALPANQRRYVRLYGDEFPLDQAIRESIPAIVRDRRPMLSKYAVETLALTGNYRELVRALTADHEESRLAAIVGLREWLAADPRHADLLAEELAMSFRDDDAAAVEELLWGYSIDDGRTADTSARLVDWLDSDEVAIRELALFHIEVLTGRDNDFHPTAPLAQRAAAVARWREFLRRNGALVPTQ